jgi:NADH-quinone oxidoreductase subunit G
MVSVMPCTSKKYEITRSDSMFASGLQDVDVSITTREFSRMIRQAGLIIENLDADAQPDSILGEYSGAGTIFGASGGVMEAALRTAQYMITGQENPTLEFEKIRGLDGVKIMETRIDDTPVRVAVAHGLANVEVVLDGIRKASAEGTEVPYDFVEVMACPGGCIGGGGQAWNVNDEIRRKRIEGLYNDDRNRKVRRSYQNKYIKQLYDEFLEKPLSPRAKELIHTSYQPRPQYQR